MSTAELSPILPGPIAATSSAQATDRDQESAAADFDNFLKLLTAQLKNQDPLSPLDSTDFIAQLASFSSVEQQVGTNKRLDQLTQQSLGGDIASFASWIGNSVVLNDGSFQATGEEIVFPVPEFDAAEAVQVIVSDMNGSEVANFPLTSISEGNGSWDGKDNSGSVVLGRELNIELEYYSGGTISQSITAEVQRRVSGLRGGPSGISLELNDGGMVSPENVVRLL